MIDQDLFFDISRDVAMATDFVKKTANSPLSSLWHIQKRYGTRRVCARFNSATNATISCKILVEIGPVVSAENRSIEISLRVHMVRRTSSNISRCTGTIFAIFSPYESTVHADDGTVLYFSICQGRCHDNQIMLP